MDKKVILGIFLVTIALAGGMFWYIQNHQTSKVKESVLAPILKKESENVKNVRVSDGFVTFSFEVPKYWLVETRNDGEKPMNEEELREFLATSHGGKDPKTYPNEQLSDYAHVTWNELLAMSFDEMKKFVTERERSVGSYPAASVGEPNALFGYIGPASQIDFYITDIDAAKKELAIRNAHLSEEVVGGVTAKVMKYAVERDENGNPQVTLGASGGKKYYILLPEKKKALLIEKQSLGSDEFEKAFSHLIQTLVFQNNG